MTAGQSNIPHSIHDRLLNISRDTREDLIGLLKHFAYEGFLRRLQKSRHADRIILKGAFLLMQWTKEYRRSTKDMDVLAYGKDSEDFIREMLTEICAVPFAQDGLIYDTSAMKIEEIREGEEYQGLRAKFTAYLGKTRISLQIDMGFGDAAIPPPVEIEYQSLLGLPAPRILSYPIETVIAEKVEAMISKGMPNSRMKDFYDVYSLIKSCDIKNETLKDAIAATFYRRKTEIPTDIPVVLTDEFATDKTKKAQWAAFIRKNELSNAPENLAAVLDEIKRLVVPIFAEIKQSANQARKGEGN